MSNRLPKIYPLRITVLSPLHMGTDEDYVPTNYVIDGGKLHAFGAAAMEALPAKGKEELSKITRGQVNAYTLLHIQSLFYKNRQHLKPKSTHTVNVASGVELLYQSRIGQVAQRERGGRNVQNRLEIERTFYNPVNQKPVLAGSGLKGAIRTALLDAVNNNHPLPGSLKDAGSRDHSGVTRQASRHLQQQLFSYLNDRGREDLSLDPMRLIHISDASALSVKRDVLFAVNRRKKQGEHQSQAEQKELYQLLECMSPGASFHCEIRIQPLPPRNAPKYHYDFQAIARACNRYYRPIFDSECRALHGRRVLDEQWMKSVNTLLHDTKSKLDQGQAMLLRAGRHSGAESVTLNGVRKIRIMQGEGRRATWEAQPKTWWLSAQDGKDQQHGLLPFGWLLVEVDDGAIPDRSFYVPTKKTTNRQPAKRSGLSPAEIAKRRAGRQTMARTASGERKQQRIAKQQSSEEEPQVSESSLQALAKKFNRK